MPETVFRVDQSKSMRDQEVPGHNRWHPDIPAASSVRPGDVFRIECKDWTDGQVRNDDSANDIRDMVLDHNHMLSGPIHVEGAEPGDLLVVDYLDLGPARAGAASVGDEPGEGWGYTGIFDINNGGGFLTDHFPRAGKVIWDFQGMYATSRHLPGVRIASNVHAGLAGCAPDADLLARWNRREQRAHRHEPGPGAAAGAAAAAEPRAARDHERAGRGERGPRRPRAPSPRASTAATSTSRTSRSAPASSTPCTCRARSSPSATCTSPRATARSASAGPWRWAATPTCTSTSSRTG